MGMVSVAKCWFRTCCELFCSEVLSINLAVFSSRLPHLNAKLCHSLSLTVSLVEMRAALLSSSDASKSR